jgi:hypothetical protein
VGPNAKPKTFRESLRNSLLLLFPAVKKGLGPLSISKNGQKYYCLSIG